jgi:hypothetical protein
MTEGGWGATTENDFRLAKDGTESEPRAGR